MRVEGRVEHGMGHRVAVTGAGGFVGRSVVRELLSRGHSVRSLVRDRARAREALPAQGEAHDLVVGDVFDGRAMGELVRGCDAMVHLIGIIREHPPATFRRMHVDATREALGACAAAGVRRFLHMSAIGASELAGVAYLTTKHEAERLVRASGQDWTIFRPSLIHGPGGESTEMFADLVAGHHAPYFFIPYFTRFEIDTRVPLGSASAIDPRVAPVFVGDVARAFGAALDKPASIGEVYNLLGSETLTWPAMLRQYRDKTSAGNEHLEPWGVPSEVASVVAAAAARIGLGGFLPFDSGMALMGGRDATGPTEKATADLGVEFASFSASFAEYAASI